MSDDAKPQGTVQIALRISPDLRERIKAAADANNRSVNSELTSTLEEKYSSIEMAWRGLISVAKKLLASAPATERSKMAGAMEVLNHPDTELAGSAAYALLKVLESEDAGNISTARIMSLMDSAVKEKKSKLARSANSSTGRSSSND